MIEVDKAWYENLIYGEAGRGCSCYNEGDDNCSQCKARTILKGWGYEMRHGTWHAPGIKGYWDEH